MNAKEVGDDLRFSMETKVSPHRWSYATKTGEILVKGKCDLPPDIKDVDYYFVDVKPGYPVRGVIDYPDHGLISPIEQRYHRQQVLDMIERGEVETEV